MPLKILSTTITSIMNWTELPVNTMLAVIMISKTEGGQIMLQLKDVETKTYYYVAAPDKLCADITTEDVIYRDESCACELCTESPAPSHTPSTGNGKYKVD